jgi:ABC-type multidrug transport system fused ATPase/permease subunit
MKTFCLSDHLRRDISATGLEPWLLSEFKASSTELGDTSTKAPYMSRARSGTSFTRQIILNLVNSAEYTWLIYEGFRKGMSLGTLHLIRSSTDAIMEKVWGLAYTGDRATDEWKSLISFFRCLELKSELVKPADPKEYVSSPAGMKLEAKSIRYKYDLKKDVEVLKGASFIINPGEMVAVVGYSSPPQLY